MKGTRVTAMLVAAGLALAAVPVAQAQRRDGVQYYSEGGGPNGLDIANGVLGIIGGVADAVGGNGGGQNNGCINGWIPPNGNNSGNNWGTPGNIYVYPSTNTFQPIPVAPNPAPAPPEERPTKEPTPTKPNEVETIPAETMSNAFGPRSFSLHKRSIRDETSNLQDENEGHADTLKDPIKDQAKKDVDNLNGYSEREKDEIKKRIDNEQSFDDLLNGTDPAMEQKLRDHSDLIDDINDVTQSANDGEADINDLAKVATEVMPYVGGDPNQGNAAAQALLGLSSNSASIAALQDADPGNGGLPFGHADVILVGGLDDGQVVSLGNGTVLVGTGDPGSGTHFGSGNVAQLAGYTAGIGDPVPDSDAELVTDGVVLRNVGRTPVNYNVNNHQFTMEPGYRQVLPGGKTWTVTFDRGGSHGTAKYGVSQGTYEFTPTEDRGWELFKQDYTVAIANDNLFTFHFVIENQQKTLAPGQRKEYQSEYPHVIRFDDGHGSDKSKCLENGDYHVAVAHDGSIDIYEAADVAPPVRVADVIPDQPTSQEFFRSPEEVTKRLFTNQFTPESDTRRAAKRSSIFGRKEA